MQQSSHIETKTTSPCSFSTLQMEDHRSADYATLLRVQPRVENGGGDGLVTRRRRWLKATVRSVIKPVSWVVFILWGLVMMLFPLGIVQDLVQDWISLTQDTTLFGSTGSFMVAFSGPVLLIALLGALYITLSDDDDEAQPHYPENYIRKRNCQNGPSYSLWTLPAVVKGPFGVVSAAELIGISIFIAAVVFGVILYTLDSISDVSSIQTSFLLKCSSALETWGGNLGMIGLFCLVFLFIPVSRGSILLRLIDIPFEHATRYHVWLGHLTMLMFTLHGMSYVVAWSLEGNLLQYLFSWEEKDSIAILPGVIALVCGLVMWATALHLIRRKYFELFFYTHYLYIGFVIFFALHVGDFIFSVALGGILIFMLDRFLRFWQSRKIVDLISVTSHSCGVLELVISKPPNLKYTALSMIFVNVRELSLLQWHPFSVSSSPMEGENHVSVLVKDLGDWTTKLNGKVLSMVHRDDDYEQGLSTKLCQSRFPLTVCIEGPYGHETPYYLTYQKLVLVGGGIGISPFIAILKDLLHRIKQGKSFFPKTLLLVWAIKRRNELPLLPDLESICPSFSDLLDLEIQVFVTQQSTPTPMEEAKAYENSVTSIFRNSQGSNISTLVGTGDKEWSSMYVSLSIVGFVVILGLVDEYLVNPYNLSNTWYIGLVLLACMVASVVLFGGVVVVLWHSFERKMLAFEEEEGSSHGNQSVAMLHENIVHVNKMANVQYGCRPKFEEIFQYMEENWGSIDVGVIVCGPSSLERGVAKEIRSRSLRRRRNIHPIFHFHSHSFEL